MKIKIKMPDDWKKFFTIEQLETIKQIPKDYDNGEIITIEDIKIATGASEKEIISVSAEWCQNVKTCFDNNIDVYIEILYRRFNNGFEIVEKCITLSDIYQIAGDADNYGYARIFKEVK